MRCDKRSSAQHLVASVKCNIVELLYHFISTSFQVTFVIGIVLFLIRHVQDDADFDWYSSQDYTLEKLLFEMLCLAKNTLT